MNLNVQQRHLVKLDIDENEAYQLWRVLDFVAHGAQPVAPDDQEFAKNLARSINVLCGLGKPYRDQEDGA